jgi:hypothetical protein
MKAVFADDCILVGQVVLYICQFAMCGISKPSQWQAAQALFVIGSIGTCSFKRTGLHFLTLVATNVVTSFYAATFPGLVRDLPELIQSEQDVKNGIKTPEEHSELDSYERSKLYNMANIVGSALVVITYAIAVGITAGVGFSNDQQLITSYRVLMGYFGAITVLTTLPFFIVQKKRAGQQLPAGTKFWNVGPK